jgi:ribA/ribD-fused uncharacterized protein
MTALPIDSFDGEFRFLSNFYWHPMYVPYLHKGEPLECTVPTLEHAFQAAKCEADDLQGISKILKASTPGRAKRLGAPGSIVKRAGWDEDRDKVMYRLIKWKFKPKTEIAARLIETYPRRLIEGNIWGDVYWGQYKGEGLNKLGLLEMRWRKRLITLGEAA